MTSGEGSYELAENNWLSVDGNEAVARVAHKLSEVIAIYPITPASPMGEFADVWSSAKQPNLWGAVPDVIEMQSEAGAAGALHGAIQKGALGTTFTASQGLLLMIPNMYKIAGELSPTVIHVAARTVATHALSIFGDHSDVMAARATGFAMLSSSSVQEAQDLALIAHAATLSSRIPFLHFFDGFRTSHEVSKIKPLKDSVFEALIDDEQIALHRSRALSPDKPVLRGSAQNPDVFFQSREAANPFYIATPEIVQKLMDDLGKRVDRHYKLIDYTGAPDAERVVVAMGSSVYAVEETVEALIGQGEKVGLLNVRLFRPFPKQALKDAIPKTARSIAVLDRTKEPGAAGEPLYQDVVTALAEQTAADDVMPKVTGGRYGLSSKEFTPAMAKGVFDELKADSPRNHFTVGIVDDVTHTSLDYSPDFSTEGEGTRALFYGLGSDGTVGACKNTAEIVNRNTDMYAQGYFVYDSKKAGSVTVSHLRFGPEPIRSSYLIERASFIACHQFNFIKRMNVLETAEHGATFLLNSPFGPEDVWGELPEEVQSQIIESELKFYVIDAVDVAREAGMGKIINTAMQPCFFTLSEVLPADAAIAAIKDSIEKTYTKRGQEVVDRNFAAVDAALTALHPVNIPDSVSGDMHRRTLELDDAPEFVQQITSRLLAGEGDQLPVSELPIDGTFPTSTSKWEKPNIATEIPIWDPSICIDCGRCTIVCPHNALQMKVFDQSELDGAPNGFLSKDFRSKDLPDMRLSIQVVPAHCTGCGVCVDMCPAVSKEDPDHKSINMEPVKEHREREEANVEFFNGIPVLDPRALSPASVKGSQTRDSLFGVSGACAGCGETPYLKLLTQLYGDHLLVANATGCSSIYGGNLPTTPWSTNKDGQGPAWSNSLFEDNAEFGLGMRLALDHNIKYARHLVERLKPQIGDELANDILAADQADDAGIVAQRERVATLKERLEEDGKSDDVKVRELLGVADNLTRKTVWIIGGDGWAYDIGSSGVDHVLASGHNVNLLVLDTQVYSNTGGQTSKATPRAAVAKFSVAGKQTGKKDLGMIATTYGNVYAAQIAIGANPAQTVKALTEAEAWDGPSIVIAYSTCIAHGIDMEKSMSHQKAAVESGFWPLYRYHPGLDVEEQPFKLDCKAPKIPLREFAMNETRFKMLERRDPETAKHLLDLAQADIDERWRLYEQLSKVERTLPSGEKKTGSDLIDEAVKAG